MKTKYFKNTSNWENWLGKNHQTENELWLVYYKKHTEKPTISYEGSVRVALCYGWIDSLIKKLDEDSYARKFNPRKKNSVWSESNKKRVSELLREGKMKPAGVELVEAAKQNGNWDSVISRPEIDFSMPEEFKNALRKNPVAADYFNTLNKRHQKEYLVWIIMAKRDETRERRINESIQLLNSKQKLGLK